MTPAELAWRGARFIGERTERRNVGARSKNRLLVAGAGWTGMLNDFRRGHGRPVLLDRARAREVAVAHPEATAQLIASADRVRAGRVTYFGYPEAQLAHPIDWHHDPLTNTRWPQRPARAIDHRSFAADPKWIWELNRLQHLPWLAQAWLVTDDEGYAASVLDHLDGWLEQNPVGRGIAWRGAFEAGIRAISVATALQGIRDYEGLDEARFERYVRVLAAGADLCWRRRSLHSSANNHLVGELAGLAVVAMLLPELRPAARWERAAFGGLRTEAVRQILPDGVGAEQAVGYQVFTTELLMLVAALLVARGDAAPPEIVEAVQRGSDHLAAVVGFDDPEPRHGDDDEGFALRLGVEPRRTVRQHLGIVGAFNGNPQALDVGSPSSSASWMSALVGPSGTVARVGLADVRGSMYAEHGGLVLLRDGGRRLLMDVGPLGHLSIAAHGHADALAVTMSIDGQEVIGDPGAASYYGHPEWRAVHRGTRVHATVLVDERDQSVSGGPFLWTRHAQVRVNSVDLARGVVDAEHDGYRRLGEPVTHRRWLIGSADEKGTTLVLDEVSGQGSHRVRVSWPLHPDLDVRQHERGFAVTRAGSPVVDLLMTATGELAFDGVRGDLEHQLGWWSDRLEARSPAWLLGGVVDGEVPMVIATVLAPHGVEDPAHDPHLAVTPETITVRWRSETGEHTAVVDRTRAGSVEVQHLATVGGHLVGPTR